VSGLLLLRPAGGAGDASEVLGQEGHALLELAEDHGAKVRGSRGRLGGSLQGLVPNGSKKVVDVQRGSGGGLLKGDGLGGGHLGVSGTGEVGLADHVALRGLSDGGRRGSNVTVEQTEGLLLGGLVRGVDRGDDGGAETGSGLHGNGSGGLGHVAGSVAAAEAEADAAGGELRAADVQAGGRLHLAIRGVQVRGSRGGGGSEGATTLGDGGMLSGAGKAAQGSDWGTGGWSGTLGNSRGGDGLGVGAHVNVLAVLAELAAALAVETADLVNVHPDVLRVVAGGGAHHSLHSLGAGERLEGVLGGDAVGHDLDGGAGSHVGRGVEVTMEGAAGGTGGRLGAELLNEAGLGVDLVAAVSGVAATLLEQEAQTEVLGILGTGLLVHTAGFLDILHGDGDLTGAVDGIDHLEEGGGRGVALVVDLGRHGGGHDSCVAVRNLVVGEARLFVGGLQ